MNAATLRTWWSQRPPREQSLLRLGMLMVVAGLLWSLALAPALRTVRTFDAKRTAQDAQLQAMLRLQAQAQALQALPRLSQTAATQALQASVQQAFGALADITVNGDSATVRIRGVTADALAQWLSAARSNARCVPVQAHLTRAGTGWSGTLQMALPAS
jgi:general secretion pathway protein M